MESSRRTFLLGTAGLLAAATPAAALAAGPAGTPQPSSAAALKTLMDGNARYVADQAICPPLTARRIELAAGQRPFAIIVSCSDSRVPVETVFDQSPGSIFGIRLAGNFVDDHGLGSIEYSVASFASSLILVLGHSDCGAVKATVQYVKDGTTQPGHIQSLVDALAPAARASKGRPGNWYANATEQNVHDTIAALTQRSTIVAKAVKEGGLAIAGGVYDLHTGRISIVH